MEHENFQFVTTVLQLLRTFTLRRAKEDESTVQVDVAKHVNLSITSVKPEMDATIQFV